MKPRSKYALGAILTLSLVAGASALYGDRNITSDTSTGDSLAGISSGIRFNDDQGNARMPTEAERAALAEAFQADIANLGAGQIQPRKRLGQCDSF